MMMCPTGKVSLLTGLAGKKIHFFCLSELLKKSCVKEFILMSSEIVWIVDAVPHNCSEIVYQHLIHNT